MVYVCNSAGETTVNATNSRSWLEDDWAGVRVGRAKVFRIMTDRALVAMMRWIL